MKDEASASAPSPPLGTEAVPRKRSYNSVFRGVIELYDMFYIMSQMRLRTRTRNNSHVAVARYTYVRVNMRAYLRESARGYLAT